MVMASGFQSPMSWLNSKVPSNVFSIVVAAVVLQSLMMFEPALSIFAPLGVCSSTVLAPVVARPVAVVSAFDVLLIGWQLPPPTHA